MNWIGDLRKEGLIKMKIDLLTIEEAEKLPPEILQCKPPKNFDGYINEGNGNCCWWLRSPGLYSRNAAIVWSFGNVNIYGNYVDDYNVAVRPTLEIDEYLIKALPRTKKGYVVYLNTKWIHVTKYLGFPCLLKKKCLSESSFFDLRSNNYEISHIKRLIEDWLCYKRKQEELKK